ncbi:NADPH cytochrome P450 oxidoreductase family protein [Aspergillus tanneri]|nr:uncharacterized protein ATNIH1004_005376 [Aspergillus tanneri]KAA8646701.1 hypothetical protein ATNIH1004_005376 [Aspergillus tanneri]
MKHVSMLTHLDGPQTWDWAEWDLVLAVGLFTLVLVIVLHDSSLFNKDPFAHIWYEYPQGEKQAQNEAETNIATALNVQGKDIVIFYGTQSGTSYELAKLLGRNISQRFSKPVLVADLSDYDCNSLAEIPATKAALFILSTYGEGDPPDNAIKYDEWLQGLAGKSCLVNLRFAILGLGNSNYKHYNRFAIKAHNALQNAGAVPVLDLFLADDAQGLTQEGFISWKINLFGKFVQELGIVERPKAYEPVFKIESSSDVQGEKVVMYRPIDVQIQSKSGSSMIYSAAVASLYNITPKAARTTLHVDVDITNEPKLKYSVGDHLAVWPENPAPEIRHLSEILGLSEAEIHRPVTIRSEDTDTQILWPQPVTLHALFKHHLDIVGLVSRDLIMGLKQFSDNTAAKHALDEMARDYRRMCTTRRMTLASVLQSTSSDVPWNVPLSFVLENLRPLKPRYYSIASTPAVNPRKISFTVAVKHIDLSSGEILRGLASNYFLGMQQPSEAIATAQVGLWCSVQKSKFKPPVSPLQPMIMVANGSGIAPFLGFLRHRLRSFQLRGEVGRMMLFYGCQNEDMHLYKSDIEDIQAVFGGQLQVIVAYSRTGGGYVQNQIRALNAPTTELLYNAKANVYICGSTAMARKVREELLAMIRSHEGLTEQQAQQFEATQLRMKKWQLDVWG